jgi:hypothetical protein
MNDLSIKLQERLALNADWTFLKLVTNAIIADDANRAHQESKKKKALAATAGSASHKYRMVCAPHHHPPQHHHHQLATCPPPHQNIVPRAMAPPLTVLHPPPQKMGVVPRTCYNYGQVGHIVRDCTAPRQTSAARLQSHCSQSPRGPIKVIATRTGWVNYTTIEDVSKGTSALNGHPVVILFDSGASHDFISKACTQRCQLVIEHMSTPYMILTPGGNVITKQLVINAPINLGGKVYKTHLIVLNGQGIDLILGMSWMRDHKALLDTASHTVQLESPDHGVVVHQLWSPSSTTPSLHHTTAQELEDIRVACEFLDVFPEDLPDMPPDRDIEFTIELQPGTTPIFRRPYKMTPNELADLKVQLNELMYKCFIRPSSSPWGCPVFFVKKKDQSLRQ